MAALKVVVVAVKIQKIKTCKSTLNFSPNSFNDTTFNYKDFKRYKLALFQLAKHILSCFKLRNIALLQKHVATINLFLTSQMLLL